MRRNLAVILGLGKLLNLEYTWKGASYPICSAKELCKTLPHKMLICPTVRNPFRSYFRAFLLLLILVGSACVTQRVPSNTESGTVDPAKTKERRNAASQLNPIGSTSSVQDVSCQNELKESLIKRILEGYRLRDGMEKEHRLFKGKTTFNPLAQNLTRTWRFKAAAWAGNAEDVLSKIDLVATEQFRAYRGTTVSGGEGDEQWVNLDNWLNNKLDFLGRFYDKLGTR